MRLGVPVVPEVKSVQVHKFAPAFTRLKNSSKDFICGMLTLYF